VDKAMADNI